MVEWAPARIYDEPINQACPVSFYGARSAAFFTGEREMGLSFNNNRWLFRLCIVHSVLVFLIGLLLFITKWFPYGGGTRWLRECLYKFF